MTEGTQRIIEIVKTLKSFAMLDEAELQKVDIHEGLEDTLKLIQHEISPSIKIIKNYGNIPEISCFPAQLNQVFLNVLINAIQSIDDHGEIRIMTCRENDKVRVDIKDTGVGIPEENLKKIFDPGFTTKGVGVGTGLGLSICYQIIQDHKGEISVKSRVGDGTTFTIILPIDMK
jgi:signal transduction histidine kinase